MGDGENTDQWGSCQHSECIQIRLGRWNTPNILSVHPLRPGTPVLNFSHHHVLYLLDYLFCGKIQDNGFCHARRPTNAATTIPWRYSNRIEHQWRNLL